MSCLGWEDEAPTKALGRRWPKSTAPDWRVAPKLSAKGRWTSEWRWTSWTSEAAGVEMGARSKVEDARVVAAVDGAEMTVDEGGNTTAEVAEGTSEVARIVRRRETSSGC